jgi:hypothetical protein
MKRMFGLAVASVIIVMAGQNAAIGKDKRWPLDPAKVRICSTENLEHGETYEVAGGTSECCPNRPAGTCKITRCQTGSGETQVKVSMRCSKTAD